MQCPLVPVCLSSPPCPRSPALSVLLIPLPSLMRSYLITPIPPTYSAPADVFAYLIVLEEGWMSLLWRAVRAHAREREEKKRESVCDTYVMEGQLAVTAT